MTGQRWDHDPDYFRFPRSTGYTRRDFEPVRPVSILKAIWLAVSVASAVVFVVLIIMGYKA